MRSGLLFCFTGLSKGVFLQELINQILLCVGYTTEGSEANPMYGYWGFLGFKIE
jgi:hypothetical protein